MIANKWRRVQELFVQASARPPEDRAVFLAEACGDDEELRDEVESLMACDERAPPDFMRPLEPQSKSEQMSGSGAPDPRLGTSIGGYRIDGVIASGGMGTVYEAVQAEPHRIVALKVLHRHVASQSALRRFRFESQILAYLRHPTIAQVFAAGMHDEGPVQVPYFAMEYVPEARTIIEYATEKELSTRKRLELFTQVCEAVHHGHQKGIIHRDLKPGNILVDSSGRPKIIDFGVARSTDSDIAMTTMQTDVGQMIGTLQFMSPEQCDADPHEIDTRSDVYSLGVVLYELLTGRLPYDVSHMTIHSGARLICEESPARPSGFDRRLRGDVETIVLKALEKDREKRYQSAAGMAEDIHRFLNGEPIAARSPTAWTRVVRWVARHPVVTTMSVCAAIAVVILTTTLIASWLLQARPHQIIRYKNGQSVNRWYSGPADEAQLLAYNNDLLKTWGGQAHSISFAELVDRGWKRFAVIGFTNYDHSPLWSTLCAFDVGHDLEEPIWVKRVELGEPLPDPYARGLIAEEFGASRCWLLDVVPSTPGLEIVATFSHRVRSQRFIRIYDLDGDLLYQAWHDGTLTSCYWMEEPGLLVFAGSDAAINRDSDGNLLTPKGDPYVVFAVRPEAEDESQGFLRRLPECDASSLAWYKYLFLNTDLVHLGSEWSLTLMLPRNRHDADKTVEVALQKKDNTGPAVSWLLDAAGLRIPDSFLADDLYEQNQKRANGDYEKLPDPRGFRLDSTPPIQPISQPAEAPPGGGNDGP